MLRSKSSRLAFGLSLVAVAVLYVVSLGPAAGNSPAALGAGTAGEAALPHSSGTTGSEQPCAATSESRGLPALENPDGGFCSDISPSNPLLEEAARHRHGYCRCSCGYPCTTSADCGGVSCDPFISCC